MLFPKEMTEGQRKRNAAIKEGKLLAKDEDMIFTAKGLVLTTLKLVTNKTYIFAVLALTARTFFGIGLATFFSKIVIIKFGASPTKSAMLIGTTLLTGMTG